MSKTLYDEAIAEAKLLKETAEQNAKNAIIEAVTPRIRHFIEEQLIGDQRGASGDESDVLDSVISESSQTRREDVVLDESALENLLELFGTSDLAKKSDAYSNGGRDAIKDAIRDSVGSLDNNQQQKLQQVVNKLNERQVFLQGSGINNHMNEKQETSRMSTNDEILYEVDLSELAGLLRETDTNAAMMERGQIELEERGSKKRDKSDTGRGEDYVNERDGSEKDDDSDTGRGKDYVNEKDAKEDEDLKETLRSLGLSSILNEESLQIDLGDLELEDDAMDALRDALSRASVTLQSGDEDVEVDAEEFEFGEEELVGDPEGEEVEVDAEVEVEEDLSEVFEIDENILRSELKRLRKNIREAKELTKVKGIKDAKESAWGGSGSGKVGVKGAYGGSGGSKAGVKGAFGGGKESGDPLKVTLNKLSEAVKNERRKNRALQGRLNEYRSAVETLREQLTDLNLFNAKLLYVNKLLQNKEFTSSQRRTVVESIDGAKSLREVKLLYRSLTESFNKGSGRLNESSNRVLGSSSRSTSRGSAKRAVAEFDRWATLAGIHEK